MRLQHRLLLTYSLLIFLLLVLLSAGFLLYSSSVFEKNARATYALVLDKVVQQFDNQVQSMEFFETNLISDPLFKQSLDLLGNVDRKDPRYSSDINDARQAVQADLYNYAAIKNFYSVNVFNSYGDYFSSNFIQHANVGDIGAVLPRLGWLPEAEALLGKKLLLPPYPDPWTRDKPRLVFGLVRSMPGSRADLGYIEVQNEYSVLAKIFQVPNSAFVRVVAWTSDGTLFYSSESLTSAELREYRMAAESQGMPEPRFQRNPANGRSELFLKQRSDESGLVVLMALDQAELTRPIWITASLTFWVAFFVLGLSVAFNWWSSKQLTRPLRIIQKRIEETGIANLGLAQPLDHPSDEIMALYSSFETLKGRLDESIHEEIRLRTLGVQAQLDSLQAQVNPHFLNNILTVLANRGLEAGDPGIGEICVGIASMLRYSTDTMDRTATLREEIEHTRIYLDLMKRRFEERLSYSFEIESGLEDARLPKIILQQLAENALNHGFREVFRPMELRLRAWRTADRWMIEFTDNGQGFSGVELDRQRTMLDETARRLDRGDWGEGLTIGGLGLRNAYGRLHLFFGGKVEWNMGNRDCGGAFVRVSAPMVKNEAES